MSVQQGVFQLWLSKATRRSIPHAHKAGIESLTIAFEVVKAMQADGLEGAKVIAPLVGKDWKRLSGRWPRWSRPILNARGGRRCRPVQWLLSTASADELSDIELNGPRTRRYSPVEVVQAYARRT